MSFDIDVATTRGDARVALAFASEVRAVALVGPSGVGKTTVLNMVAGLIRPECGHVRVGGTTLFDAAAGVDVPAHERGVGYVFQEARLFPHLGVRANLLYGAPKGTDPAEVARLLEIDLLGQRWPRTLSGGEARRVAIARALLSKPKVLLMDEPLVSLDRARREEAMRMIERVRDEVGLPMLIVTHDEGEAARLGQAIVRM
jgi:molybdate transport system ATP-binding protein